MRQPLSRSQEQARKDELSRLKRGQFLTAVERENLDQLIAHLEQELQQDTLPDEISATRAR